MRAIIEKISRDCFRLCSALSLVLLVVPLVHGALVASWDLTGDPGDQATEPAASGAPGVAGNPMVRGTGLSASAAGNSFSSSGWEGDAGEYIEFGFTVGPLATVDLENLTLATRSSATGPGTIGLYTSLDAFAAPVHTFNQSPGGNFVNTVVDLTSLAMLLPGPFAVRLIEIGNTQADGVGITASAGTFRVSEYSDGTNFVDVQFNGTVTAIPEASQLLAWTVLTAVACAASQQCRSLLFVAARFLFRREKSAVQR